jgi:hypothetical protein
MSNLSPTDLQAAVADRVARRNKLKEAYQRLYNNPFRVNHNIIDPMLFRYEAARAYARNYYKFTPRSIALPLGLLGFTVWFQTFLNEDRNRIENEIRTGQKTYYERALWKTKYHY